MNTFYHAAFTPVTIKPGIDEPTSKRVKHTVTTCNPYASLPVYSSQYQQVNITPTHQHQEAFAKSSARSAVGVRDHTSLSASFAQDDQA